MIKLICQSCGYSYSVSEAELKDSAEYHSVCLLCGGHIEVENTKEVVQYDVEERVKNNIDRWVKDFGWDNVIDMIKRHSSSYAVGRLYIEELKRRGFAIKEE